MVVRPSSNIRFEIAQKAARATRAPAMKTSNNGSRRAVRTTGSNQPRRSRRGPGVGPLGGAVREGFRSGSVAKAGGAYFGACPRGSGSMRQHLGTRGQLAENVAAK